MRRPASRLLVPLLLSCVLFAALWFVSVQPLSIRGIGDIRYQLFGENLRWLKFLAWIPLVFFIVRLIDSAAFDWAMSRRPRHVAAPVLLREIVSIALFLALIAWVTTKTLGVAVTGFLATGTVLAAVLGLALQETLGNLFAGIALHLEDSFEIGDVIRSGDFIGVVENSRWRGTRIRTFNNNIVILPNSLLARERLEVFPRANLNARVLQVGVDYAVAPSAVINVLTQAMQNVEGISRDIPPLARVGGFGESALTYEVKYHMHDYSKRDRIDSEIRKAIWYALRRNGMTIPFPIRSVQRYHAPQRVDHQVPLEELTTRLRDIDILSPLSAEEHSAIASAAHVHFYAKGETIIRHRTAGSSMFIVHDGTVAVRMVDDDATGGYREVAQLGEGSFFGEMALLTGETRTADVVALTDVQAIEIAKDALAPVLHAHPELASTITSKVIERRGRLDSLRAGSQDDDQRTVLTRIRAWFGIR